MKKKPVNKGYQKSTHYISRKTGKTVRAYVTNVKVLPKKRSNDSF